MAKVKNKKKAFKHRLKKQGLFNNVKASVPPVAPVPPIQPVDHNQLLKLRQLPRKK